MSIKRYLFQNSFEFSLRKNLAHTTHEHQRGENNHGTCQNKSSSSSLMSCSTSTTDSTTGLLIAATRMLPLSTEILEDGNSSTAAGGDRNTNSVHFHCLLRYHHHQQQQHEHTHKNHGIAGAARWRTKKRPLLMTTKTTTMHPCRPRPIIPRPPCAMTTMTTNANAAADSELLWWMVLGAAASK